MLNRRVNIGQILRNPRRRRELMIRTIQATQNREGIPTTYERAAVAYDKVQAEKKQ